MSAILLLFCLFRRRNKWKNSYNVRESKTLLDSGFHAVDSEFHLLDFRSFSVELGFRIRIVSGIPDSYTCIPDSKAQDSGFHKQKFPRFRIPNANISRIPGSGFLYMDWKNSYNVLQIRCIKVLLQFTPASKLRIAGPNTYCSQQTKQR